MQGAWRNGAFGDGGVRLELTPTTTSPLSLDITESTQMRIQRLISENPVIIFSRSSCCMCLVMKRLFFTIGVHPTVIELDEEEIDALPTTMSKDVGIGSSRSDGSGCGGGCGAPAVYIGGDYVGGLESLVGLHLSGRLVPKLVEVGVLKDVMFCTINPSRSGDQNLLQPFIFFSNSKHLGVGIGPQALHQSCSSLHAHSIKVVL